MLHEWSLTARAPQPSSIEPLTHGLAGPALMPGRSYAEHP